MAAAHALSAACSAAVAFDARRRRAYVGTLDGALAALDVLPPAGGHSRPCCQSAHGALVTGVQAPPCLALTCGRHTPSPGGHADSPRLPCMAT